MYTCKCIHNWKACNECKCCFALPWQHDMLVPTQIYQHFKVSSFSSTSMCFCTAFMVDMSLPKYIAYSSNALLVLWQGIINTTNYLYATGHRCTVSEQTLPKATFIEKNDQYQFSASWNHHSLWFRLVSFTTRSTGLYQSYQPTEPLIHRSYGSILFVTFTLKHVIQNLKYQSVKYL